MWWYSCTEFFFFRRSKLITNLYLSPDRKFQEALAFLDDENLVPQVVAKCCERVILKTHCLSLRECCKEKYENYVEMLHQIEAKLGRATAKLQMNDGLETLVVSDGICKKLKSVHYLKVSVCT